MTINSVRFMAAVLCGYFVIFTGSAFGQEEPSDCVILGAMAYDNWTKEDAGGTGSLPPGVESADYIRCKACHGWDRRGIDGGYVRRSRTASRPNAGAGDGDDTPRAIFTGVVTTEIILHEGTGRSYVDGAGSWVELDETHSAVNKAAHTGGYTLGNQHPDFSADGPSEEQIGCLAEFLNYQDGDPDVYFESINPNQDPVLYSIVDTADAATGEAYFNNNCMGCHNLAFAVDYLVQDGKFSEFAHKARWGIPDTIMSRSSLGNPTAADVADMMLYLQQESATGFAVNPGLTGTWWGGEERAGEGFLLQVGADAGLEPYMFASFYTYDPNGNQIWLTAQSTSIDGTEAAVTVYITSGPMWGVDFDRADVNLEEWGAGTFTFTSCSAGSIALMPNETYQAEGFTDLAYDLSRDDFPVMSLIACPTPNS